MMLNQELGEANIKIEAAQEAYLQSEDHNGLKEVKDILGERVHWRDKLLEERVAVTAVASLADVLPGELMRLCIVAPKSVVGVGIVKCQQPIADDYLLLPSKVITRR